MPIGTCDGTVLTEERQRLVAAAYQAMMALTDDERGYITCWFCPTCNAHIGAGESHECPWEYEDE